VIVFNNDQRVKIEKQRSECMKFLVHTQIKSHAIKMTRVRMTFSLYAMCLADTKSSEK
jgi:hypothetical protein